MSRLTARNAILWIAVAVVALGVYAVVHRSARRPEIHARGASASGGEAVTVSDLPAAPELSVTDINGAALDTASFKGKVVLVNFWAAWCAPCAEEVPQFIALEKKYQGQGLQVIGVSVEDDPEALLRFYRKYRMNYPVLAGDLKIADAFGGVLGLPTTFLIGRDNRIHGKHNGATDFSTLEREVVALLRPPQS
jgi:cytochrome c biogenesis protein CcmG/thiol:disulfide interchange protein DsbE